jgi:hypothetical protein
MWLNFCLKTKNRAYIYKAEGKSSVCVCLCVCVCVMIFLNIVYIPFCILTSYIYILYINISSHQWNFLYQINTAVWLLHYLVSLPIGRGMIPSASVWSLNSCRGFFHFISEGKSSGVMLPYLECGFLFCLVFCFVSAGHWTQSFVHTKLSLCHWTTLPVDVAFFFFLTDHLAWFL